MNLVTFSGPPSSGKTSVILKTIQAIRQKGQKVGVVKFDCLYTEDDILNQIVSYNESKIDTFKIDVVFKDGLEYRLYNELTDIYKDRNIILPSFQTTV